MATGAKAGAWCLLIHDDASLSLASYVAGGGPYFASYDVGRTINSALHDGRAADGADR